ncbi:carboxymuconolactone decarboxylase family protein [Pseudobacteriovorax antillogorgiicola]|uniref:Uncharacterized peroxidase-related enzyme n=1 Tax=Pseudobacteriovorax antillogorgiicola TaxID=1513793 RepID=A0A1Y6CWL8_9BACT|nr:carboxymuconolactone decarboxylase family protein [Pseudobacteriovorax antillogorgiicola]TCS42226.1 putative peroxidase-related enzyme [Pseudobacteriovorax antillogorgiicola]SMF82750.1 uncharacterized peroxidase-related enzyme [Pseudobacteriovorax antillogorgiicola]
MSTLPVYTESNAPSEESQELLSQVKKKYGFIPNLLGEFAASHPVLQAYMQLGENLSKTSLTPLEQQLLLVTISRDNNCTYCVAAHTAVAVGSKLDQEPINAVREGRLPSHPKLQALVRFAEQVVGERGWVSQDQVQAFIDAGYSEANVLDVVLAASMKTLSNYTNHIFETPVDANFQPFAWKK